MNIKPQFFKKDFKQHGKACVFHLTLENRQKMGHWKNKKGKVGKHNLNVQKYVVIMIVKVCFLNKGIRKNPPYENNIWTKYFLIGWLYPQRKLGMPWPFNFFWRLHQSLGNVRNMCLMFSCLFWIFYNWSFKICVLE